MVGSLDQSGKYISWLIIGTAFCLSCIGAFVGSQGDLASSRLATVYSLTEHGTWYIDQPDNNFANDTIDKVVVRGIEEDGVTRGGRLISSKPPIMPLIMTGMYIASRAIAGWTLTREDDVDALLVFLTVVMISGSFLLALIFFRKTVALFDLSKPRKLFLLVALAFGTQLAGYSITINNHVPGAAMLVVALYHALALLCGRVAPTGWRFAAFGVAGALVPTLDMPAGIYVAAAGCALLYRYPKQTILWTFSGAAIPLAVHFGVTWWVTGSLLPVQMREATYMYESAYWRHPLGIDALSEPKFTYLFHTTFGRCGIFLLFPVLLLGLAGVAAGFRRDRLTSVTSLVAFVCFAVLVAYYVSSTNNYGGESYGFRWYIASMPILLLMAVPAVQAMRGRFWWSLAGLFLAVSCFSAAESAVVGWQSGKEWTSRIFGPAYVQVSPEPSKWSARSVHHFGSGFFFQTSITPRYSAANSSETEIVWAWSSIRL